MPIRVAVPLLCLVLASLAAATGCALPRDAAATRPDAATGWLRTELYFGLGAVDAPADAARWRRFLDTEVTPRFPDDFTVLDAYGQWREPGAAMPERLRSRLVVILHPDTPARRADIDAIRAAWTALTGDTSVLRATQPAEVAF
ncbi:DUF3574 domain-containing protein [Coralloluteibacterium stylophorae]|uniref:DUF3574 domain-containing protein n=1 Tax=Coralloluteibacterium stylophorae TaxID=1776034 RepID=UPI001FEA2300|nr:DUF3574 domain-containing protein [Coralloluteibacterium stylophorae]